MKIQMFNYHGSILDIEIPDGYCICHPNWVIKDTFLVYDEYGEEKLVPVNNNHTGYYCKEFMLVVRPISEIPQMAN